MGLLEDFTPDKPRTSMADFNENSVSTSPERVFTIDSDRCIL